MRFAMKFALLSTLLALCLGAIAKEPPPPFEYTKPDSSLFLVSDISNHHKVGHRVVWRGKVWLTGKLVVEYCPLHPCSKEEEEPGRVFFEPDPASEARLPAVTSWYYPRRANVVQLEQRPLNVLLLLLGQERAIDVHLLKPRRHEYSVRVLMSEFRASVDCNARHYVMTFERLELVEPDMVALDQSKRVTCAG